MLIAAWEVVAMPDPNSKCCCAFAGSSEMWCLLCVLFLTVLGFVSAFFVRTENTLFGRVASSLSRVNKGNILRIFALLVHSLSVCVVCGWRGIY